MRIGAWLLLGCARAFVTTTPRRRVSTRVSLFRSPEPAQVCVIGGGVSGLVAAITAAEKGQSVVLVEAAEACGGRVQSDASDYILDRGFAVFIDTYPAAKELLDYDKLDLQPFQPGALVRIPDTEYFERVADPLRQPKDIVESLFADIGFPEDKILVASMILYLRTKSVRQLFQEPDTDTLTDLTDRWGFSDRMIRRFFRPFLEGIYLAPLHQQSSRMFYFVMKMFAEGSATLPRYGMKAVADQLVEKAKRVGVDIRTSTQVGRVVPKKDGSIQVAIRGQDLRAERVIVATEGPAARELLSGIEGVEDLEDQPQRAVGNLYYSFEGDVPATAADPILVLNGEETGPINNLCFPSLVSDAYAPASHNLCSVTVLEQYLNVDDETLDAQVRKQLQEWFPKASTEAWKLERVYRIARAQPAQYGGPLPASTPERDLNMLGNVQLPSNIFVCGDHVSTATLNGALESGRRAGVAAAA